MSKEFIERLSILRKQHNLSQEELANRLNVSRQAVSKWERGESSPDTDNLVELASIYNITLDELIYGKNSVNAQNQNLKSEKKQPKNSEIFEFKRKNYIVTINKEDVKVSDDNGERLYNLSEVKAREKKYSKLGIVLFSVSALVVTIVYLMLGFSLGGHGWSHFWFLFILLPVIGSFTEVAEKKSVCSFNFVCFITAIYCGISSFTSMWHPMWVLFLLIPIYYIIAGLIDSKTNAKDFEKIENALDEKQDSEDENEEYLEKEINK